MKVAILNISIGEYIIFWENFYKSAQKNFLTDCDKEYFVFTDKKNIYDDENSIVHVIFHENMGWPFNTMKRYHMFKKVINELKKFDYIFFINANAEFNYPLTSQIILPNKDIIVVEHPGMHFCTDNKKPFERRKESRAYVACEDGKVYVQGAFLGGKRNAFINMIKELDKLTEADLQENIIAIWHDESFLNHYITYCSKTKVQILGWQYLKYEEYIMPYDPVIVLRDKRKYLSKRNDRFLSESFLKRDLLLFLRNIKWYIMIRLHFYKYVFVLDNEGNYIDLDVIR